MRLVRETLSFAQNDAPSRSRINGGWQLHSDIASRSALHTPPPIPTPANPPLNRTISRPAARRGGHTRGESAGVSSVVVTYSATIRGGKVRVTVCTGGRGSW